MTGALVALLLALGITGTSEPAVAPRVLVVATFAGEAQRWVARDQLARRIPIAGVPVPLFCNAAATECLIVTGMGNVNMTASILVAGQSGALNLRSTYVLLAGVAGTTPAVASLGSVAWARWVVDAGAAHEIDPREPSARERYSHSKLGCGGQPWCTSGWRTGTEVLQLDAGLRDWAYRTTRGIALRDSAKAQRYRAHYAATKHGERAPQVLACDVVSDDTYWHGAIMSSFATWWMNKWTDGRGTYCMSTMEDTGFVASMQRLASRGDLDMSRVMILRGASNYDQPYPGQSPAQSLVAGKAGGGFELALENIYLTGEVAVKGLLARPPG